ncbi:DUF3048 domain-containing protein [Actinomyces sp. zg-332]|uniref:DUF3048 domain-containing protein n=1 Tax=Actinomyces sp. zg-332 TaxID=2708340 RepID=UPI0014229F0B|nr:DUF3048 domain-containing protein [Actinomyces sp. zg-332]QPK94034.1 DUF3048 domain-containing protein [Actinomyces sp. zg-332]
MKRCKGLLAGVVAVALVLTGCSAAPEEKAAPKPPAEVFWPLTGQKASSEKEINHPALSMKIENVDDARPHVGLDKADIVWEQMVEGGLTRFNVVYHSQFPNVAGPMRSVRPMDAGISAPLHGVFACSGGQQAFMDSVSQVVGKFINETIAEDTAHRDSSRFAPHNLFLDTKAAVDRFGKDLKKPESQLAFATGKKDIVAVEDSKNKDIKPANALSLEFPAHTTKWDFDKESGSYLRTDNGSPLTTQDGTRISAKNVIVMSVDVHPSSVDSHVPETVMVGKGNVKIVINGKMIEGTWEKTDISKPVVFKDSKGKVIKLAPGKTWIELLPNDSSLEIS